MQRPWPVWSVACIGVMFLLTDVYVVGVWLTEVRFVGSVAPQSCSAVSVARDL